VNQGAKPNGRNGVWLRLALLALLFAAGGVLLWRTGAWRWFTDREEARRFIAGLGAWGFAGFVFLQALQVVAAPVPGEITGVLGGFLFGPLPGIALSTAGLTLGSLAAFGISRVFGRPVVEKLVARETLERFDFILHQKGIALAFLLFLLPGFPKDYLCYILGLGHLSTLEFLLVTTVGRLLGTIMLTVGGSLLAHGRYVELGVLSLAAIAVILVLLKYRERLERRFHGWQARKKNVPPESSTPPRASGLR
jgi:uncharacterized membrane protein YdjX (TVP38/TMEM64 family)